MKRTTIASLFLVMLFLVSVFPSSVFSSYAQTPALVGYWNFDQGSGTIAYDSFGSNNHGTIARAS